MNTIERTERKCNSQLLKEYVLALPDEENISLELIASPMISTSPSVSIHTWAPHERGDSGLYINLQSPLIATSCAYLFSL